MKKFFRGKRLAQFQSKYKKIASFIAIVVVFATTYALILPAITLDSNRASQEAGIEIAEPNTAMTTLPSIEEAFVPSDVNTVEEPAQSETEVTAEEVVEPDPETKVEAEPDPKTEKEEEATEKQEASENKEEAPAEQSQDKEESDLITETKTLTADHKNYTVTAEITAEAKMPKDVELKVTEISEGASDYQSHYQKAQKALDGKEISDIQFFDISFEVDGKEVQPQADVKITITPAEGVASTEDDLFVLHLLDDGKTEKLDITDTKEKGDKVTEVSFESSSFSPYMVGGTSSKDDISNQAEDSQKTEESSKDRKAAPSRAIEHTVTFIYTDNNGDQVEVASTKIENGNAITTMPDNPFREGYRFTGWKNQETGETVTADTVVNGDMTVVGQFEEIKIYTVTVHYYYFNNSANKNTVFETEIFQMEEREVPYRITPPASTKPEEDTSLPNDTIYYPEQPRIEIADTAHLESLDAGDGTVDKQITIDLEYVPYTAQYNVHYMLKDLTGDGYSEIEEVLNYGILHSTVRPQILTYSYANFEKADEVEITQEEGQDLYVYYTRKSYTLSYNTNGGSYVTWQTGLFESEVPITNTVPTKRGYTFDGWYDNPELSGSPVTGKVTLNDDITLYAKWRANNVNYVIAYYREVYDNSTGTTHYVYDSSRNATGQVGTTVQASSAPAMSNVPLGYERETAYGKNANSSVVIDADGQSVLKVYYSLIRYTFIFNANGPSYTTSWGGSGYTGPTVNGRITIGGSSYTGSQYRISNIVLGQDISSVWPSGSQVTSSGSNSFAGWYNSNNSSGSNSELVLYVTKRLEVTTDLIRGANANGQKTYQAYWRSNLVVKTVDYYLQSADNPNVYEISTVYSQTYNSPAGSTLNAKDIAGFTVTSRPSDYPDSSGYWSYNEYIINHYRFYYTRDSFNIDYYYGSTKLKTTANVLFDANINSATYNYTPSRPAGVDDDYTWGGWYTDANLTEAYTFDKMPSSNLVLYAKWIAPSFTVDFNLNGGDSTTPNSQTVEKYDFAEAPSDPSRAHYNFDGWFTEAENGERYDWSKPVTENMTLYAHWVLKPLTYTVKYVDADNNETRLAADKVITSPALAIDQTITEKALAITGYRPDNNSKSIVLDYDNNVITFYYTKKAAQISYTIRYLLEGTTTSLKDPVTRTVDGSTIVAKESAVDVGSAYYPLDDVLSLTLSSNSENNVITFYYTTYDVAHITVNYLDMDGNPIPGQTPLIETKKKPEKYRVKHSIISGYTYHSSEDISDPDNPKDVPTAYQVNGGEQIVINLYYQKDLKIEAANKTKVYDGTALTSNAVTDLKDTYKALLESGDVLTDITFTGSQTDVGSSATTPSAAVIEAATGNDRTNYYNITYVPGTLTVTALPVTVIIDGQKVTKVYDGVEATVTYEITSISDDLYLEDYINFNGTSADKSISQTDSGTYDLTIDNRFTNTNENFDVQFQVSNGQLVINKRPVTLTSPTAEKAFDGTALTAEPVVATEQPNEGFVLSQGVESYNITGSQTNPGSSENTFTYTLKSNTNPLNYDITEVFGRLLVTPTVNIQKTKTDWTALSGGKFELSQLENGAWVSVGGVGTLSNTSEAGVNIPVGLRAGSYRIKETAAPDGYIILDSYVYFTITESSDSNGQITFSLSLSAESEDKAKVEGAGNTYSNRIQIANKAGKALPSTGGSGKRAFTLAGLSLMLLALLSMAVLKPQLERSDKSL
jgi:uncharacterized repeat protein (TIGR02543 family)/LPXTG-motif cell wall-anchored protein